MQAHMNTDSRRKASAAYHAKREAEGLKKVTLWLSPEARFKLDALKAAAGSKDKAAEAAIMAWEGPDAPVIMRVAPSPLAERQIAEALSKPRLQPTTTPGLQLGPTRAKPGDRAKKGKAK